jgi:hypothetical protein
MSKKKNTLQDLDEFLKQQAASLVTPEPVSAKAETVIPPTDYSRKEGSPREMTTDVIYNDLYKLAEMDPDSFRQKLYALIVQIVEAQPSSLPEDKMLINTALYLKSGEHWKEAIRDYWRKRVDSI